MEGVARLLKLVALLSFYREQPSWLYETVSSLVLANVSDVVCVDGAYQHFKKAKRRSSKEEHEALRQAGSDWDINVHLKAPPVPWRTEPAKRNFLFRKGEALTTTDDWMLVVDGDEVVTKADLEQLETTDFIVATGTLEEPHPSLPTTFSPMRRLYKALRGIHLKAQHDCYYLPDGRILWGIKDRVPSLDLQDEFTLLHRTHFRDENRKAAAKSFYRERDARKEEARPCEICGADSIATAAFDWEVLDEAGKPGQRGRLTARSMWVCPRHKEQLDTDARRIMLAHGFDSSKARGERQNV